MAKCPVCNSKKGKRKCLISDGFICSSCCGEIRREETCSACVFYKKPKRNYNEVPAYSVPDMNASMELESYGYSVESALCSYDIETGNKLRDSDAIRIIELLIDVYHFKDDQAEADNQITANGFTYVHDAIKNDLNDVDHETIVKILGVLRFVAKRRTRAGREYISIIHQFVGQRIESNIRVLRE